MSYSFDQLTQVVEKNHSTLQDSIKNILTIGCGMLAILTAFHSSTDLITAT